MTPSQEEPPAGSGTGSVAEEAARLLGALSGWARDHGAGVGDGLGGLADQVGGFAHQVDRHLATGGAECVYCPLCRTIHLVRQCSPEVRDHLVVAATSLVQAALGLLAVLSGDQRRGVPRGEGVEHIDLDDEGDWPGEEER